MKILFASQNKGKQNEVKELLRDVNAKLMFPSQFLELSTFDVNETGTTFIENAIIKAKAYAYRVNLPSIADDSGVIIDEMKSLLGVKSNRWFKGSDDDRNAEVLKRLGNKKNRVAKYITATCYFNPISEEYEVFEETLEGKIGFKIIGEFGFAYDRIFIPNGYTQTFAQLGTEVKNRISQRAKAYRKLKKYLKIAMS